MSGIAGYYDIHLKRWVSPEFNAPAPRPAQAPAPAFSGVARPAAAPVQPQAGQVIGGGLRQRSERHVLADVVQEIDGDDGTNGTARARIIVPSPALLVTMTLGYELATAGVIGSYVSATWSATLMRPAADGGRDCDLHSLWASETLPQGRAVSSLAGMIAISAALQIPTVSAVSAPGQWVLEVKFVPAYPMCPEDVDTVLGACQVRVVKKLLLDIAES